MPRGEASALEAEAKPLHNLMQCASAPHDAVRKRTSLTPQRQHGLTALLISARLGPRPKRKRRKRRAYASTGAPALPVARVYSALLSCQGHPTKMRKPIFGRFA